MPDTVGLGGGVGERTTVSQLNECNIQVPSINSYAYSQRHILVQISHLIREISLCTGE